MYRTVLITGASGFIGSHLVRRQVTLGRFVRALDLHESDVDLGSGRIETVIGDVSDPAIQKYAVQGVDVVFHLASAHLSVKTSEETYWRVNAHCLRGLLEHCRRAGVKRFVHVSSVGVYGQILKTPADENSPCQPELLYEQTKYEGEMEVQRFFEETGFPIVIVRPAWVYGPGCPRTLKLFSAIRKGRFFFVGDGRALRHCIFIYDLLDGLELCATQKAAVGKLYIFGDHQAVTLTELVETIANILNVKVPRFRIPLWLGETMGRILERGFAFFGGEAPFSRRSLRFFTGNTAFNISRARQELGFNPRYDLSDGLRVYADWLANQSAGGGRSLG